MTAEFWLIYKTLSTCVDKHNLIKMYCNILDVAFFVCRSGNHALQTPCHISFDTCTYTSINVQNVVNLHLLICKTKWYFVYKFEFCENKVLIHVICCVLHPDCSLNGIQVQWPPGIMSSDIRSTAYNDMIFRSQIVSEIFAVLGYIDRVLVITRNKMMSRASCYFPEAAVLGIHILKITSAVVLPHYQYNQKSYLFKI